MNYFKNIIRVLASSMLNYGSSFIIGLILPALLSVEDYGRYKEYLLYLSFAFIFNLGFNDGVYIKYGGKEIKEVDRIEINEEHNFMILFQMIIFSIIILYSLLIKNQIILWFSLSSIFLLINTYHQNLRQAMGEFKEFSNGNMLRTCLYVSSLLIAIFVFKNDNFLTYIILTTFSYAVLSVYYEIKFNRDFSHKFHWDLTGKLSLLRIGIFILVGNMSISFVANIGSWVTNYYLDIVAFAQYSFQNSLLNITLMIVNAVSLVFYNMIARNKNEYILNMIKSMCLYIGLASGLGFFIIKYIVTFFLPDYIPSLSVLSITFMGLPFIIISNILFNNMYKARKDEKRYFRNSIVFALGSLLVVVFYYSLNGTLESIAVGTLISYILWYLYNTIWEFEILKTNYKELFFIITFLFFFPYISDMQSMTSSLIYYSLYLLSVALLSFKELKFIFNKFMTWR